MFILPHHHPSPPPPLQNTHASDQEAETGRIPGHPGLTDHRLLSDRRHVLTRDAEGGVAVWDLLTATRVPDAPAEPFAAAVERDVDRCRLPAWCSVNTQLGTLTVQLHPSTAFKCEAFLDERDAESPDVNFGQAVVQALLREVQEQTMVAQRLDAHPGDTTPHAELQELYRQQNLKQGKSHDLFSIPEHTPFYFTIPADGGAPLTSEVFKPVSAHHRYHHHHSFVGILLHMHRAIWLTVVAVAATAVVASCQRPPPPSCCFCSVCLWSITAPARVAIASPQSRVRTSLARVSDFLPDWVRDCLFSTVWATLGGDGGDGVGAGMRERGGERGSDLHDRIHWHGVFRISPQRRQQRRFTWF